MTKLQPHKPKHKSLFLGQGLRIRPSVEPQCGARFTISNPKSLQVFALGVEWVDSIHNLFVGVGVGLPCTVMECGDIIYRSTLPKSNGLTLTAPGVVLALGALSYLWATPGVAPGFFDMFVLAFVERLFRPTYRKVSELKLISFFIFPIFSKILFLVLILIVILLRLVYGARMILLWGRSWERDPLEWFIERHWSTSPLQRYYIFYWEDYEIIKVSHYVFWPY